MWGQSSSTVPSDQCTVSTWNTFRTLLGVEQVALTCVFRKLKNKLFRLWIFEAMFLLSTFVGLGLKLSSNWNNNYCVKFGIYYYQHCWIFWRHFYQNLPIQKWFVLNQHWGMKLTLSLYISTYLIVYSSSIKFISS